MTMAVSTGTGFGTVEQRTAALAMANARRAANAATLRGVRALSLDKGCELVVAILEEPDDDQAAMPVGRLLLAVRRLGEKRTLKLLKNAGVTMADRRVGALTERQVLVLSLDLRRIASQYRPKAAA